jgi:hypothetical protein
MGTRFISLNTRAEKKNCFHRNGLKSLFGRKAPPVQAEKHPLQKEVASLQMANAYFRKYPEDTIYTINSINPNHGYFIYYNQLYVCQYLSVLFAVFKEIEDASVLQTKILIIRQHRPEWEFKERVKRHPSGINCGNTSRCKHYMFFFRVTAYIFQEG